MPNNLNALLDDLFSRDPVDATVAVVDGYGVQIKVQRGHLVIEDGIGPHRRTRRYSRGQRTLRRIVILGHTGYLTLDALRWCTDLGISLAHIDGDGRLLTVHADPGIDDPRIRRAQAAAATSPTGFDIARQLLSRKMQGQADILEQELDAPRVASVVRDLANDLSAATDLVTARDLEAQASNTYFGAWASRVWCRFAQRDHFRVPDHWRTFTVRRSPLHRGGRSPRNAADPVNALLNYSYALAEPECRTACLAVGLDPGLGIVHTDKRNRDSLALDLLEVLRPAAERHVLRLLHSRYFRASDFHETRHGACRLLAPTTHELATLLPGFAKQIAAATESVAHSLANSSPGAIAIRTPLSRANTTNTQQRGQRTANRRPQPSPPVTPSCRTCGDPLTESGRQLCPTCWPVTRHKLATERAKAGNAALADMRARGVDPTNAPEATAKRSTSLSQRKREELAWTPDPNDTDWTDDRYRLDILPRLTTVPLSRLQEVTGLSNSACSRIRSGKLTPHRRHWPKLAAASD